MGMTLDIETQLVIMGHVTSLFQVFQSTTRQALKILQAKRSSYYLLPYEISS